MSIWGNLIRLKGFQENNPCSCGLLICRWSCVKRVELGVRSEAGKALELSLSCLGEIFKNWSMGLPNFTLVVLCPFNSIKSIEISFLNYCLGWMVENFLLAGLLRLLFNEVKYALGALCEPAPDSCSAGTCWGSIKSSTSALPCPLSARYPAYARCKDVFQISIRFLAERKRKGSN